MLTERQKLEKIVDLVINEGTFDGGHHKQWALDQILRVAMGDHEYKQFVESYESQDEFGEWDTGIAP